MNQTIYFIGIKGTGMSALACILKSLGYIVYGSDTKEFISTQKKLEELNIKIFETNIRNIKNKYDYIIKGNAFNYENNIEVKYLIDNNISFLPYNEFLNLFLKRYLSVAVSGTHGKTTTTSLITCVLRDLPIISLIGDGTGYVNNAKPKYFIFEACEYREHFLSYNPDYLIINNIEWDHPDYYKSEKQTIEAFTKFAMQTKKKIIANFDFKNIRHALKKIDKNNLITYGYYKENDYSISEYNQTENGISFRFINKNKNINYVMKLPFFGKHMMLNVINSIIIGIELGLKINKIEKNLLSYKTVNRRFNIKTIGNFTIINDYAHHPTEIKTMYDAITHKFPNKKKVLIYQEHTYTRTKFFLNDYIKQLTKYDVVYITEIYASPREKVDKQVINLLSNNIPKSKLLSLDMVDELLKYNSSEYILVFMGAGDIEKYLFKLENLIKN